MKRNADGTYNFSDMIREKPADEKKEADGGLPLNLNVKQIAIEDAKLSYDDAAGAVKSVEALLNADLQISSTVRDALSSDGGLNLVLVNAVMTSANRSFKNIRMDVKYRIDANMAEKEITIHSVNADIMKIPVQLKGNISYAGEPSYALDITVPNAALAEIPSSFIASFLPPGSKLSGNVSAAVSASKKPAKQSPTALSGQVKLNEVSLAYKGINPVIDGSLKLSPDVITIDGLRLVSGENSADLTGTIKNYSTFPNIDVALKSRALALDSIVPGAGGPKETPPKTPADRKEMEPMNLKMVVNAAIDIGKTTYKGTAITNFNSRLSLKDNVVRIAGLNGNTLSGAFAVKGMVNLAQRGTRYDMNARLNGMRLEELVDVFAPKAKGKLVGTLSGTADISGAGTLPENVKRNLKGKGAFTVKEGAIRNAELASRLLAILGLSELREIPIQTAEGNFTIGGGAVNLKTVIAGRDLVIDETGTIGMDTSLDLGIVVRVSERLAPQVVSQSAVARFLSAEKGWTSVPLRVGGTLAKPSYTVDTRAVGKKVKEGVQKRLGEELMKRLQKEPAQEVQPPAEGAPKKSIKPRDLLRDLFK